MLKVWYFSRVATTFFFFVCPSLTLDQSADGVKYYFSLFTTRTGGEANDDLL